MSAPLVPSNASWDPRAMDCRPGNNPFYQSDEFRLSQLENDGGSHRFETPDQREVRLFEEREGDQQVSNRLTGAVTQ